MRQENNPTEGTPVAAVDLGSNSFHMIVARPRDGHFRVLDRLREMVRLAAGLDRDNDLSEAAQARAIACLERFGQRLREMPPGSVRVVGTNTLRKARNSQAFLEAATAALGHPIDIIAGVEEARLIYLGVSHSLPQTPGRRLVMDIGGGSTELIIGEGFEAQHMESLYMGCVSASQEYFPDGAIGPDAMEAAVLSARVELEPLAAGYRRIGWDQAIGASGTIRAVASVVRASGWCEEGIDLPSLHRLRDALVEAGHVERASLSGLRQERAAVFPGGVAVLLALFEDLGIERLRVSDWALREGLLYDLLGRIRHEDVRERTIVSLSARYNVDAGQAVRVEETARHLLASVAGDWALSEEEDPHLLGWAARLHEVGVAIAHSQYHKHGAYILENSDLPGFSRQEQKRLAALVRGHRRKFPQSVFKQLGGAQASRVRRLCVLLRLAVLLHRSRTDTEMPTIALRAGKKSLRLDFVQGWLDRHPLTRADLVREAAYLKAAGYRLEF